jgi:hypothetical protein
MPTPPILSGATFYDKYLIVIPQIADQNIAPTQFADALPGEIYHEEMAPIDPSLFSVTSNGKRIDVVSVDMHKSAILTLSERLPSNAKVIFSYRDPDGDQKNGVLQDNEGEDAGSATLQAEYVSGSTITLLDGAELGAKYGVDDEEWYFGNEDGFYVENSGDAGGQPDTPINVLSVKSNSFVAEIRPVKWFPNPSYSASAVPGSFKSYRYSNEYDVGELLKNGRDIKVGDSFTLMDLLDPERSEKALWMKRSVMVTNDASVTRPQKIFDIDESRTKSDGEIFWLNLNSWMYDYKGASFNQYVVGSRFQDEVKTLFGNDTIDGAGGNDFIDSGAGIDSVIGGAGDDSLNAGDGNDFVVGGTGSDEIEGGDGADKLAGGEGTDDLTGGTGNDSLDGGAGNDTLYSGDGNDSVSGGDGTDLIVGGDGAGNDSYDGGKGIDTVKYTSAKDSIRVDLTKGTAGSMIAGDAAGIGADRLRGIENIIAGDFADFIVGSKDHNTIMGEDGDDTINGGLGKDTLTGGFGADVFVFGTKPAANNIDTISDFKSGEDKIQLGLQVFAKLKGASDYLSIGTPSTATQFLMYDTASGKLSYDADGNGARMKPVDIALIGKGISLSVSDFILA